jgi:UMF1 family MFS transporter
LKFFSALLPTLGKISFLGRMSGWGEFANNAGLIFGVLLTLPFVNGSIKLFGGYGRSHVFLPASLAFLVFAIPFFLFFKEKSQKQSSTPFSFSGLGKETWALIKGLPKFPSMMWFLIGFYFVSDAMRTIILFFPLYFDKVLSLSDSIKAGLTMFSLFFMMIGAIIGGAIADRIGTKKTLLGVAMTTLVFILVFTLFTKLTLLGWIVIAAASISMGGYFGVSRAMLIRLAKGKSVGKYFGLYNLFERFASFIAPILFGWTLGVFGSFGPAPSYRLAYFSTFLLIIFGLFFFKKIKEKDVA